MARPLSDTARRALIDATLTLIAEGGPDRVTVDEVARRSGVAKTTLYRHFDSSADLLLTALASLRSDIGAPDTGSLRGDLTEMIQRFRHLANTMSLRDIMIGVLNRSLKDDEFSSVHQRLRDERTNPIREVLTRAAERGELRTDVDIDTAIALVEGPFIVRQMMGDVIPDPAESDAIVDLIVHALCTPR